ncbi:hypothetical protein A3D78_03225 [Candidatus Gottesmanbacteria bacterium RIFCSPHIGHO2_02_FULL_39_14]|uniref:Uncharacterized protein n=3 Tax=Candidatus Gottesmaniibacteriota TaxID=1752720 RepID=A0A1F5ZXT4_9BACT|nr:MAG: hypothetical protein A2153_06165 [Candidatus Gottesmanbacteria bacterium RBG_16_38_7b]OGG17279.1 MAG: hypothetical protein A3D78_03225 [Candidatus Gottesmanbacteria bacterium RIFCSPHIGHO2_02_FULL_39_14]OGG30831.1 MAG: hypothetical protein A3I51_03450 [Candidatus Gottesmanbacteria bacterium RIFCSPLOWO2_02_FULL_38_8]
MSYFTVDFRRAFWLSARRIATPACPEIHQSIALFELFILYQTCQSAVPAGVIGITLEASEAVSIGAGLDQE